MVLAITYSTYLVDCKYDKKGRVAVSENTVPDPTNDDLQYTLFPAPSPFEGGKNREPYATSPFTQVEPSKRSAKLLKPTAEKTFKTTSQKTQRPKMKKTSKPTFSKTRRPKMKKNAKDKSNKKSKPTVEKTSKPFVNPIPTAETARPTVGNTQIPSTPPIPPPANPDERPPSITRNPFPPFNDTPPIPPDIIDTPPPSSPTSNDDTPPPPPNDDTPPPPPPPPSPSPTFNDDYVR